MKAMWTKKAGLTKIGKHKGQPRQWTVTAWAKTASGEKETVFVRPRGKTNLKGIVEIINQALYEFELERGETVDAGFVAVAR